MDVCIYSTLMVELLQISRMMSDLEFIITIGVMQLITTSELSSIANCFMIPILCSKCMRTACVTELFPAETSSVGFLPPGQARIPLSATAAFCNCQGVPGCRHSNIQHPGQIGNGPHQQMTYML